MLFYSRDDLLEKNKKPKEEVYFSIFVLTVIYAIVLLVVKAEALSILYFLFLFCSFSLFIVILFMFIARGWQFDGLFLSSILVPLLTMAFFYIGYSFELPFDLSDREKLALFTVLGVLILVFFLNEFTPIPWQNKRDK